MRASLRNSFRRRGEMDGEMDGEMETERGEMGTRGDSVVTAWCVVKAW